MCGLLYDNKYIMIRNGPDIIMPLDIRQKSYTEFVVRPVPETFGDFKKKM